MRRHQRTLQQLREPTGLLRRAVPATWAGFTDLHEAAMADGQVPKRLKEAAALAISVVKRCDGCIAYDARGRGARRRDANGGRRDAGGGAPHGRGAASVYAPRAWEAFTEFAGQADVSKAAG
jgi:AhpD family alkylhydroperoxidase